MPLFFKKGIRDTKVDEIAEMGKISRVTIYKYFPAKVDIAVAVFYRYHRFWSSIIRENFFSDTYLTLSGFEQIVLQLSIYSKIHMENPAFLPFLSELNILISEINPKDELDKRSCLINKDFNEFYFHAIQKGLNDGSICKRKEFEAADYLYVRKIIEGIFIGCYLCFGREHFSIHQKEVNDELIYAVDKISTAFFKPTFSN